MIFYNIEDYSVGEDDGKNDGDDGDDVVDGYFDDCDDEEACQS